ncbi:CAP domain-containing protein [Paenibacillus sp. MMS20-IR301]|uniref:CAP domain-containing protein n=1 Tax=Paenibacillus sp. MMS20-IR301 TaxID=2895946 RepID=UPI0028E4038D|nr:CAP domain-containing protein [Paenibacillus sp. MMS20-IR301]WNS44569.1 CAP domain-containing protein [Paenibacillus sp. MMS20-IR301]
MKNKTLRAVVGGSVAAVMALGISLPLQANAASGAGTATGSDTNFAKFMEYFTQYNSKVFVFDGNNYTVSKTVFYKKPAAAAPAATAKPAATAAPVATAKPVVTPAATAKPAATPAPAATAKPAATAAPTAAPAVADSNTSFTQQVVTLVNKERAAAGLAPVAALDSLNKVAAAKASDMRTNNYFSHTSPTYGSPFDMMSAFGITYKAAGENIAMGQRTPQEVMTAWMNSPGHKANILSANFNYIGVGFDNNYWVQEFIGK